MACSSLCAALISSSARVSTADDFATARSDIASAGDYHVRASAARVLGRAHRPGARAALEHALDDSYASVRDAAAEALGFLGDDRAVPALERHLTTESSPSVRDQCSRSLAALRKGTTHLTSAAVRSQRPSLDHVRYVVRFGDMHAASDVHVQMPENLMHDAAASHRIPNVLIDETGDPALAHAARLRRIPLFELDGTLMHLQETHPDGQLAIRAQVEFAVTKLPERALKGSLTGSATSLDSSSTVSEERRHELESMAIEGAVASALNGAERGFALATR